MNGWRRPENSAARPPRPRFSPLISLTLRREHGEWDSPSPFAGLELDRAWVSSSAHFPWSQPIKKEEEKTMLLCPSLARPPTLIASLVGYNRTKILVCLLHHCMQKMRRRPVIVWTSATDSFWPSVNWVSFLCRSIGPGYLLNSAKHAQLIKQSLAACLKFVAVCLLPFFFRCQLLVLAVSYRIGIRCATSSYASRRILTLKRKHAAN